MLAIFTHSIHFIYTKKLRQIRILLIEKKNGWDGGCGGGGGPMQLQVLPSKYRDMISM